MHGRLGFRIERFCRLTVGNDTMDGGNLAPLKIPKMIRGYKVYRVVKTSSIHGR